MHMAASVRHAIRTLARAPLFTLTSVASLTIGIGACATMFSLADALFLRPRPGLVDEARLVDVARSTDGQGFDNIGYPVLRALQGAAQLDGLAGYRLDPSPVSLDGGSGGAERCSRRRSPATTSTSWGRGPPSAASSGPTRMTPRRVPGGRAEPCLLDAPVPGLARVVGQTLRLNGRPYAIIGVAEAGFEGTTITGADVWVPFAMAPHVTGRSGSSLLTAHGRSGTWPSDG